MADRDVRQTVKTLLIFLCGTVVLEGAGIDKLLQEKTKHGLNGRTENAILGYATMDEKNAITAHFGSTCDFGCNTFVYQPTDKDYKVIKKLAVGIAPGRTVDMVIEVPIEEKPNKSADSTTSAGTSAAEQPRVPASAASHL